MASKTGHYLGLHRVIEPKGALPQAAQRLDATSPPYRNEVVIDVATLNVDSASFSQIIGDVGGDEEAVAARIESIVRARGKMQNPVTGSGGMLLGQIIGLGPDYRGPVDLAVGDRVASLVSLTLTPLDLRRIKAVHLGADQVDVEATAYLWPSSPLVVMPDDLYERVAQASLDVSGAPAQTERLVADAKSVLILGAGKSGMLCAAAARKRRGSSIAIYGIDWDETNLEVLHGAGLVDAWRRADATQPVEVLEALHAMSGAEPVDLVINTCNMPGTEMSAILPVRQGGTVYFFNMATDFSRAALGCEGVGRDADLLIGNGYATGHAELTLEVVRSCEAVRRRLQKLLG